MGLRKFDGQVIHLTLIPLKICFPSSSKKLRRITIRSKRDLISNIIRVWNHEISKELIEKLVDSMPNRIEMILKKNGSQQNIEWLIKYIIINTVNPG